MSQTGRRVGFAAVAALVAVLFVVSSAGGGRAVALGGRAVEGAQPASLAWTRTHDPVTLSGADLPEFLGAPLAELYVYALHSGTWSQIPFQFDEVDAAGEYSVVNGLLDAVDELTLMGGDLGEQAPPDQWIDDPASTTYPRFEVEVTNPLNPAEASWVYVYRSATLVPAYADYVAWDGVAYRIVAGSYVIGLDPAVMAGTATLELNGSGVDVLDRMKVRAEVTCWIGPFPILMTLTEEDLAEALQGVPEIDGAVRVGGGSTTAAIWFYRATYATQLAVSADGLEMDPCTSITIDSIRQSSDWLDPSASGMAPASYYDDNTPGGVAIDGVPDGVPGLPAVTWQQVSGGRGTVVTALDISFGDGAVSTYYLDNSALNGDDTGDQRSFGDAGFIVDEPAGLVQIDLATYVLDPLQPNVGPLFKSYQAHPLQATAVAQAWQPPCEPPSGAAFAWDPPAPLFGTPVSFSGSASGTEPIDYAWSFGDGGVGSGPQVTHIYPAPGTYTVAMTAGNACGSQTVQQPVTVLGTVHLFKWALRYRELPTGRFSLDVQGRVHDQGHAAVAGIAVSGVWTYPNGATRPGTSAPSDAAGRWRLNRRVAPCGLYTFDVTGMSGAGYLYDPASNEMPTHLEIMIPCE